MCRLAIFALGPLRVELDGQPVQTSRHKALALLTVLALDPAPPTRERLSALLWPDYEQEKAFAYLRRALWELHSLLGEGWLEASREAIRLDRPADLYLDVAEFQGHLAALSRHAHPAPAEACPECLAHLRRAALLYRGDFLAGFHLRDSPPFEDWQFFRAEALRQAYAGALQKLGSRLLLAGDCAEAAAFAQRWLALDTLDEAARRLLMSAFAAAGQRHLAVRQYQECQRILRAELGVDPAPETQALFARLSAAPAAEAPEAPPRAPPPAVLTHNLPAPATAFVGREPELGRIAACLSDPACWLLTLLGPGGIGKTRLAVEAGRRHLAKFPQGVFLVALNMVETEPAIAPAIARALGLALRQNGPAPQAQLVDFLRAKRLLLILDSFEHFTRWAAWLAQIHAEAPGVRLLVTSRHKLLVPGEWVLDVGGLDYPAEPGDAPERYGALQLFLQAARRSRVAFQASPADLAAIVRIARLLEGMPLGLELAATWTSTLSCPEIAAELKRGLDLLEASGEATPQRQRSLRAACDHSWNLLNRREQTILPRLAVFRGSFSRQAAEQVAGVSLRELAALVDKSLVRRAPDGRFDLHDLLRQYGAEVLAQRPADSRETRSRHGAYYCARLSEWRQLLRGERQGQALREIEQDQENCQAAWDWAADQHQREQLEEAADTLGLFYLRRARLLEGWEAFHKANAALRAPGDTPPDRPAVALRRAEGSATAPRTGEATARRARLQARLLTWQAALSLNLERLEEAGQLLEEAQPLLIIGKVDPQQAVREQVFTLIIRSVLANRRHDPAGTAALYRQAAELVRAENADFPAFFVFNWMFLMSGSVSQEVYQEVERYQEAVRQAGDPFETGCVLFVLGIAELFHRFRMEAAEPLLRESIWNFERVDDPVTQSMVFKTHGFLLLARGEFAESLALKQRELKVVQDLGDQRLMGIAWAEVGEVLCHQGEYAEAEKALRQSLALLKERSEPEYALRRRYLGDVLLAQGQAAAAREAYLFSYRFFRSVGEKGWMVTALTGLSRAELALGDGAAAWGHAREALGLFAEIQLCTFFVYLTLADLALLLAGRGEAAKALEIYHLAARQGFLARSRWFADLFGKPIAEATAALSAEERASARARGLALDLPAVVGELLQQELSS